jgi:hypothetical protein
MNIAMSYTHSHEAVHIAMTYAHSHKAVTIYTAFLESDESSTSTGWWSPVCKGNLTNLRRELHLSLAKGNPK